MPAPIPASRTASTAATRLDGQNFSGDAILSRCCRRVRARVRLAPRGRLRPLSPESRCLKEAIVMSMKQSVVVGVALVGAMMAGGGPVRANGPDACKDLPSQSALRDALIAAQGQPNGGFALEMWATVVNRDGVVCAVAFTGDHRGDQWPGSRVISAQKANTANAFSLPGLALSTANLYSAVQPGGSLFGLQESNPVSTQAAYGGNPQNYGQHNDPMVGARIGGVNVFGGGLGLYAAGGQLAGAIG